MKQAFLIITIIGAFSILGAAQTTAFNFQGRLNDGSNPANGRYDLQFKLFDQTAGGNQVGAIVSKPNLLLINGVFSTQLDFGATGFSGGDRFLEIQLRPAGSSNAYVILGARQQILSVPYSVKSFNASNADNATNSQNAVNAQNATNAINAQSAVNSTNATNATTAQTAVNSQQLGGTPASQFVQQGGIGTVKAMAFVSGISPYNIASCYNSTLTGTAATTPPCGITVNHFAAGGYGMGFNFSVTLRPAIVTVKNFNEDNTAAYLRIPNFSRQIAWMFAPTSQGKPLKLMMFMLSPSSSFNDFNPARLTTPRIRRLLCHIIFIPNALA